MNRRTILLLRHGETNDPAGPGALLGRRDVSLSGRGLEQACSWRDRLARVSIASIVCSDLRRCRETAEVIAEPHGVAVTVRPTLREIDLGAWDGLRREQIETRFPGEWRKRGDRFDTYRPQGGETFLELQQRAVSAYCSALAEDDGNLLIVAHAGVHRAILSYLLEMPVRNIMRLAQAPGCMNIVSERDGSVRVEGINIHPGEHPVLGGTPWDACAESTVP